MWHRVLNLWLPGPQQAGEVLDKTSQTDAGAKLASKGVAKAIVQKTVLDHKDKASDACRRPSNSQMQTSAAVVPALPRLA